MQPHSLQVVPPCDQENRIVHSFKLSVLASMVQYGTQAYSVVFAMEIDTTMDPINFIPNFFWI